MKLSIAKKLGFGFGVVILLMVVSATIAYFNLSRMSRAVDAVIDEAVPTVRACDQLLNGVNESHAALRGFMILGKNPQQAQAFESSRNDAWQNIDKSLSDLEGYVNRWGDREVAKQLIDLKKLLQELRDAQQTIEDIARTDENIMAYRLLLAEAAPRAEKAINSLTAVIDDERDQDASAERKALLAALADTRGPFVQGVTSIRAYMLTRDTTDKDAFHEKWRDHQRAFERVRSFETLFTPKQQQHWQDFVAVRSEFEPLPAQLFALRDADDWNKAEYLMKKETAPRAERLKEMLAQITATADTRKDQSRADMDAASIGVTVSLWLATLAAVVISAAIAVTLSRKIVSLMRILAGRATDISNGDLTGSALLVKSGDELGQLADGFDTMLANLKDLTGQILSVTENVNSAASQISSSAKQQASSTKEQASTVQEITSTMQEIALGATRASRLRSLPI